MKLLTALCIIALAFPVLANDLDLKVPNDGGPAGARVDCDVNGCDYYGMTVGTNFDDTAGLLAFGPITTAGGCAITNVVLSIDIDQTWVGDLIIDLYYDEDSDGNYDYGPVTALCRPQLDGCPLEDCCGCSGNVVGVFTFGDDAAEPLGEYDCPGDFIPGCFLPAIESPAGFADTFAGAAAGGDFWLEIGDGAGGDITYFNAWGVYVCCGTTASESTNWGQIKSEF